MRADIRSFGRDAVAIFTCDRVCDNRGETPASRCYHRHRERIRTFSQGFWRGADLEVDIRGRCESDKKGNNAGHSETIRLYRKLVQRDPKDLQARIFLANALRNGCDDNGEPRSGQKEGLQIFQTVLQEDPDNSAANRYWIHAFEASPHPEQDLHSAEILGSLAHMVHMPGPIFFRDGRHRAARESLAASMKADELYMKAQPVKLDDDWNYVHNLMYVMANLSCALVPRRSQRRRCQ